MNRREFFKKTAGAGLALASVPTVAAVLPPDSGTVKYWDGTIHPTSEGFRATAATSPIYHGEDSVHLNTAQHRTLVAYDAAALKCYFP